MNGRAPEYRHCNEVTLVKTIDNKLHFKTFWKNVHQQFLISEGFIYGLTYEIIKTEVVRDKESGNRDYKTCRAQGWQKWEDFCKENGAMCLYFDFGSVLI